MNLWIWIAGWALVHFAWQGVVIALTTLAILRRLRAATAQVRYAIACAALAAMMVAPVATARVLYASAIVNPRPQVSRVVFYHQLTTGTDAYLLGKFGSVPAEGPGLPTPSVAGWSAVVLDVLLPAVVVIWLVGVSVLLVRLSGGWWRVRRLHRKSLALAASRWQSVGERLASRLSVQRAIHVVDSLFVDTPTVVGWWRPVVLLPIAALANLSPAQVESILAHELAHVRRHDYLVNLLQTTAETLLFYHPAVWWVSGRIRTEREHCCDDIAVSACGDAVGYAEALTELETWRLATVTHTTDRSLALAATGGSLLDRVRRVLGVRADDATGSIAAPTAGVVLLVLGVAAAFLRVPSLQATDTPHATGRLRDAVVVERRIVLDDRQHVLRLRQTLRSGPPLDELEAQSALGAMPALAALPAEALRPRMPAPAATSAAAQGVLSIVSGTIHDPSGTAVSGATLVLNDLGSSANRTTTADESGHFQFVDVTPVEYVIDVTTPWSEPIHDRVSLSSGATLERSYSLQLRGVTMGTRLIGPGVARAAGPRVLPNGWACVDDRPVFCGPPSLAQEFQDEVRMQRAERSQTAFMIKMWDLQYPQGAWEAKIEGTAVVEGRIGVDGAPTGLRVTAPVYPELAAAALAGVGSMRFEPARLNGTNVEVPLTVRIEFRLHP